MRKGTHPGGRQKGVSGGPKISPRERAQRGWGGRRPRVLRGRKEGGKVSGPPPPNGGGFGVPATLRSFSRDEMNFFLREIGKYPIHTSTNILLDEQKWALSRASCTLDAIDKSLPCFLCFVWTLCVSEKRPQFCSFHCGAVWPDYRDFPSKPAVRRVWQTSVAKTDSCTKMNH